MRRLLAFALFASAAPVMAQAASGTVRLGGAPVASAAVAAEAPTPPADVYDVDAAPAYYVVGAGAALRELPEADAPVVAPLRTRDGVRVLDTVDAPGDAAAAGWRFVHTDRGRGYVRAADLSNVWIRVDKSERMAYVYRGAELLRELPVDVSQSDEDKVRRSRLGESEHYRIPEGTFFVTRLHDTSRYYRAFVLSYPNPVHALRGLEAGIITEAQYAAIVRADQEAVEPPMNTPLGGLIELHGHGSGRQRAWTRGCVALRNVHMDELWEVVEVGTPVVIER